MSEVMIPGPSRAHTVRIPLERARELVQSALEGAGLLPEHSAPVARQYAAAERDGIPSHGLARVPAACEMVAVGKIKGNAEPRISTPRAGLVHVEADDGFPHLGIERAADALKTAAVRNGIAAMSVANGYACGVLGYHTEFLCRDGLIVLGFTEAPASIAPWGGKRPVVGTNPMSLAIPRPGGSPILIDQSSSVVAKSEVMDRHARGEPIPSNWAFDKEGAPTTSTAAALQGGTMAPFGGYKGFGVALIVEIFASFLTGSNLGIEAPGFFDKASGPPRIGAYFIGVDPSILGGADAATRLARLLNAITDQPGTRLPGARRQRWRERTTSEGVEVPRALHDELAALAG